MDDQFAPLPQPEEVSIREREDGMGAYLMMFAALAAGLPFPALNLIAAVIYYYVNRKKGRFVHFHLLQSLYSQIPTTLLNMGLIYWVVRIVYGDYELSDNFWGYLAVDLLANLVYIILSIYAAMKARKGEFYYFFFFGKIAYAKAFAVTNTIYSETPATNKPPKI